MMQFFRHLSASLLLLVTAFTAQALSTEEISPEALQKLMAEWKPLEVSGDAIAWSVFAKTQEKEVCAKDEQGYTYCLLEPIYSDEIRALDGKEVTLMGYMFPLEETQKQKNFLIGPYPLSCPFHYHVGPSQFVEVLTSVAVDFSYEPVSLKGILRVRFNKETEVFYYLENAKPL